MTQRPIEILLVEDSPADVWLTREALQMGPAPKHISVVTNGEQALDFLHRQGPYGNAPRPDLILLDVNLPRVSGIDVLRHIKADPELRTITVVVLSTSELLADVNAAYDLNANCYIVKPLDYEQFTITIRGIEEFWMALATLPGRTPPVAADSGSSQEGASADNGRTPKLGSSTHARRFRVPQRPRRRTALRTPKWHRRRGTVSPGRM